MNDWKFRLPLQKRQEENVLIIIAEVACQSLLTERASKSHPQNQPSPTVTAECSLGNIQGTLSA